VNFEVCPYIIKIILKNGMEIDSKQNIFTTRKFVVQKRKWVSVKAILHILVVEIFMVTR